MTKTTARRDFRLRPRDLAELRAFEVKNPHYATAAPMRLYLKSQVEESARRRWGSSEPYDVQLVRLPPLSTVLALEDQFTKISPGDFEDFVAERFQRMGYEVQRVGAVNRKDGGVDLIVYPRVPLSFLIAVQVKHHRSAARKTGPGPVRELLGSLAGNFVSGVLVTNTTFTPDARFFAEHHAHLLRLRDIEHLRRWVHEDYDNEHEWSELPREIELAPGVRVAIPKPVLGPGAAASQALWTPQGATVWTPS